MLREQDHGRPWSHGRAGQDPEAPWVLPLERVVDTEALRPPLSGTTLGSRN